HTMPGPELRQPTPPPPPKSTPPIVNSDPLPEKIEDKPSPMPPPESTPVKHVAAALDSPPKQPPRRPASRPSAVTQGITHSSSPAVATATLDGHPAVTCIAPCSLDVSPGRHNIAFTLAGYQIEHREVEIGSGPIELAPVILRAPGGTLMLTSIPLGA